MITKTEARDLLKKTRDYIPGGKPVSNPQILQWRPTTELEIHHCGVQTGDDLQSGPYYCGALADFVAEVPEGTAAVCRKHHERLMNR
jgi:hypothetical protein